MTVSTENCYAERAWTGVEATFTPGFAANAAADVLVYSRDPANGAVTQLTLNVHYGVSLGVVDGAVTVTPIALPAAPRTLLILRNTPALQDTNFSNLGKFSPLVHTRLHDAAALRDGEDKFHRARALKAPLGETLSDLPASAARASKLLGFDGAGQPVALNQSGGSSAVMSQAGGWAAGIIPRAIDATGLLFGASIALLTATALEPVTAGVGTLGAATKGWAAVHLASGGEINFGNGNGRLLHSPGAIIVAAGRLHVGVLAGGDPTHRGTLVLENSANGLGLAAAHGIEFKSANTGAGYGWRVSNPDLTSENTPLVFQARVNDAAWTERLRLANDGAVTVSTTALALAFGIVQTGFAVVDGASWPQAFGRIGAHLNAVGTAAANSANQAGLTIQCNITGATNSLVSYEKAGLHAYCLTNDPSGGGISRDAVGATTRGYIASTNPSGAAWGGTDYAIILQGGVGDGSLVGREIDVFNYGTAQPNLFTTTQKIGLQIIAYGTASSTCALFVGQADATPKWYKVIYSDPAYIEAGGVFLELAGKFTVDKDGVIVAQGLASRASIAMLGATSGTVTIATQAAAGTYNFNLPTVAGAAGQPLLSGGGGGAAMTFGTLGAAAGGTGVANNAANTITFSGNFGLTLTLTGTTSVTLPVSGTLASLSATQTFTGVCTFVNATGSIASFRSTAAGANVVDFATTPTNGAVNDGCGVNVTLSFTNGTQYQAGLFRCVQTNATSGAETTIWQFYTRSAGVLNEVMRLQASQGVSFGAANVGNDGGAGVVLATGFRAVGATSGIGYGAGAGGTVTQLTSKATGVTLNKASGQITTHNAALAANTTVSFTLTNSAIAAGDLLLCNHISGGTGGAYYLNAQCGAGIATINLRNVTGGSLSEAIVIAFALIKGATT